MALKQCKDCGKEVSSSAPTCPNCGKKNPSNRTSALTWFVLIGLLVFAYYSVSSFNAATPLNAPSVDKSAVDSSISGIPNPNSMAFGSDSAPVANLSAKEEKLFRSVLRDDIDGMVSGKQNVLASTREAWLPVRTTASNLQSKYEDNEVAGDKEFLDKPLIVRGTVASIDRSIGENYFVSLSGGSNPFLYPHAKMADGYTDYLSSLKKGQEVRLFCKGDGMLMGSASLSDCIPLEVWKDNTVNSFMSSLHQRIVEKNKFASLTFIMVHVLASKISDQSACFKDFSAQECDKDISPLFKNSDARSKISAEMNKTAEEIGIDVKY